MVCDALVRIFKTEGVEVVALQGLDLVIDLLHILSGLDEPTAGLTRVASHDLLAMSARRRLRYRRYTVGFVWQQTARNLLPY